ncbi:hypothetical protein TUMSATVNIG1_60050 (plasmid) [Vibrio nigripulchritudo]|nr:hypothetical protein VNTUMSATTG_59560 [Vibrio nigripulchritudo]BDU35396.1 hypothetical protein TUMSATVNIG1_60050 [Vibrio nigripulchritudo]
MLERVLPASEPPALDLSQYLDLGIPCPVDKFAIMTESGSRLSLIEIEGQTSLLGSKTGAAANKELLTLFTDFFSRADVQIVWGYSQDPLASEKELKQATRSVDRTGKKLGLEVDLFQDDLLKGNSELCVPQNIMVAIWTLPSVRQVYEQGKVVNVITDEEEMRLLHKSLFGDAANPFGADAQNIVKHKENRSKLLTSLRRAKIQVRPMIAKSAAQWIDQQINKDSAAKPLHFIDESRIGVPVPTEDAKVPETGRPDNSKFFVPNLSEQIVRTVMSEDEEVNGLLKKGKYWYATHDIEVMPRDIVPFLEWKHRLDGIPLRLSFILKPQNRSMSEVLNNKLNRFTRFIEKNKAQYEQMEFLRETQSQLNYPAISFQIEIVTWSEDREKTLRQSEDISRALVDFGGAGMRNDVLSPYQTFFTSVPGASPVSYAPSVHISADRLVQILPHQIEASYLQQGGVVLRHSSGKPMYFQPQNKNQLYDLTLNVAVPRSGKTVLMNFKDLISIFADGVNDMCLSLTMDIGPTSKGRNQFLKLLLEKVHGKKVADKLVVSHDWDPINGGWYYNPCSIRFGQVKPTKLETNLMKSFYETVCSNTETGRCEEGTSDVLYAVLNFVFEKFNKEGGKKKVERTSPLYRLIKTEELDLHIDIDNPPTYFDLRDQLFSIGNVKLASLAHQMAMPIVDDLIAELSSNQMLIEKFNKRFDGLCDRVAYKLTQHRSESSHLSSYTTLELEEAQFLSFDLKPMASDTKTNSGRIKLFSEYLLALDVGMRNFFLNESILEHMPISYRDYWKRKIEKYSGLPKNLTLDEWHLMTVKVTTESGETISTPVEGAKYIESLIKEAPKWGLSINISSHSANDFTPAMRDLATNVFFFGGYSGKELQQVVKCFDLNSDHEECLRELHGPRPGVGPEMLYRYRTNLDNAADGGLGFARVSFLCCGPILWGLNSSAKDLPHKLRLEREFGDKDWLQALINAFPSGQMQPQRDELIHLINSREQDIEVEPCLYQMAVDSLEKLTYSPQVLQALSKK